MIIILMENEYKNIGISEESEIPVCRGEPCALPQIKILLNQ